MMTCCVFGWQLFSHRTKQNKTYTFDYSVVVASAVSSPAPMQQEDSQELIKSVLAVATNSTSTAVAAGSSVSTATPVVDGGYVRLPQEVIAQSASSGKITVRFTLFSLGWFGVQLMLINLLFSVSFSSC
jgi:hypothetical protein